MVWAALTGYAVGAIPVGWLVARASGVRDIRERGSGAIGTTNVLRTLGRVPAGLTLAGDVAKGALAVWLGTRLGGGTPGAAALAAVAAIVGNCWPVFVGFRGGKGVATGLGAFLSLAPWATVPSGVVFVAVTATTRWVSLGSLLAALGVPGAAWALGYPAATVWATLGGAALIVVRHRENIERLAAGTERRLGRAEPGERRT